MKRNFSINDLLFVAEKKQRGINRLEYLSNDIFYEIFDHLDGYDILQAFSNLNHRFQTLINHSSTLLKLNYQRARLIPMQDYQKEVVLLNKHRILSLNLIEYGWSDHCLDPLIFDASFARLESLTLRNISKDQLQMYCSALSSLPRLYSLKLSVEEESVPEFSNIFSTILSFPVLKLWVICIRTELDEVGSAFEIPTAIKSKPSSIEYFRIRDAIPIRILVSVLEHLPNIRHLEYCYFSEQSVISGRLKKLDLPHLKQISIDSSSMNFNQIEDLIRSIGQQVECFKLDSYDGEEYFDAKRWEQLIKNYLPGLRVFDMNIEDIAVVGDQSIYDLIGPFYSNFWVQHQWFPSISFCLDSVAFRIHPYRKQWFDRHREIEIDWKTSQLSLYQEQPQNTLKNSPSFNELGFRYFVMEESFGPLIDDMKHLLANISFTQLCMQSNASLSCLFTIANDSLKHLDSLILTSIESIDLQCSIHETRECQTSLKNETRIKKVKIDLIKKIEDVQLILDLFPKLEYLELYIQSNTFTCAAVLHYILMYQWMKVSNLRSICFDRAKIDRNILDLLRQVLDDEPRVQNYHLRCIKNQIFVQWRWYEIPVFLS